ncbi:MAG: hypothetical protein QOE70_3793 [Chthoniobacter sp.]|jgi:3D (Asp-Asp-Asp) domain-containing protein|nr:hypothetical protein [Chthoniobacter sp.]
MKRNLLLLTALITSAISCFATPTIPGFSLPGGDRLAVRTTAYTANEPGGAKSAIGTQLRYGGATYSAASDWSWLPLGTRFRMRETGRTYVIEDYGSALVGRKTIDLFMPSGSAMRGWGVRNVNIEILQWGSWEKSLEILKERMGHGHVRRMVASLRQRKSSGVLLAGEPSKATAVQ